MCVADSGAHLADQAQLLAKNPGCARDLSNPRKVGRRIDRAADEAWQHAVVVVIVVDIAPGFGIVGRPWVELEPVPIELLEVPEAGSGQRLRRSLVRQEVSPGRHRHAIDLGAAQRGFDTLTFGKGSHVVLRTGPRARGPRPMNVLTDWPTARRRPTG